MKMGRRQRERDRRDEEEQEKKVWKIQCEELRADEIENDVDKKNLRRERERVNNFIERKRRAA